MRTKSLIEEITERVARLPAKDQQRVLEFADALDMSRSKGTPGKDLLRFAGAIDQDDLELMKQAIEEECERVDASEW